jgi:hypothetical protein
MNSLKSLLSTFNWLSYIDGGNSENDCVPAAIAHVIQAKTGVAPTDISVQAAFQKWQGGQSAGNVGLIMAKFYKDGLDKYKPACFGPVSASVAAHKTAIDRYSGFIAGLMGAHQVAAVNYDDRNIYFVSDGVYTGMTWDKWLSMVDSSTYAFSELMDYTLAGGLWWWIAKWFGGLL